MRPGDRVGTYRIESVLGRGGMGVVYEATQLSLNRKVALKVLPSHLRDDGVFRERFRREGEIQAAMDHPHIVTIYEAGETDEGLYLAMRLVRGRTLKELISAGELDAQRTMRLLAPIAAALDSAHAAGLTHRDVKPQNILVGAGDHPYLADFGLTRSATDAGLTRTGQFVGTIDYVSPEQIRGEQASAASDVYALTAVLYESLSGEVPYPRPSDHAILFAHLSEPPPRATERRPGLSAALDDVIARGMAKEPSRRPTSCSELLVEAERAISTVKRPGTTRVATPVTTPAAAAPDTESQRPPATAKPTAVPPGSSTPHAAGSGPAARKRVLALAAAALAAIAATAALVVLLGADDERPPPTGAVGASTPTPTAESTERSGDPISMRPLEGADAVANAGLLDYGSPPPRLRIELTPYGPRYQLILFQDLEAVRRYTSVPDSALHVLGGGSRGDLTTGSDQEPGTTGVYAPYLPAGFRRYRYFGVVRARGSTRELVIYDRVDRLTDPR